MSTDNQILSPHWPDFSRLHKIVAIILAILLLLLWLVGYGPGGSKCAANSVAGADCELSDRSSTQLNSGAADSGAAAVAAGSAGAERDRSFLDYDVPQYQAADGIEPTRVYFGLGSYAMPDSSSYDLSTVYASLAKDSSAVAVVSGYHDPSGDLLTNQELAKNRALSVRDALIGSGVAAERVILEKPFQSEGSGPDAEARRVEVQIARLL